MIIMTVDCGHGNNGDKTHFKVKVRFKGTDSGRTDDDGGGRQ